MAADLGVGESGIGLLVTVYAFAAGLAAIPVVALTRGVSRYRLMLAVVGGFAVVNLATALIESYALMIGARLAGGVITGVVWSIVGGYAAAAVPESMRGKAVAVALGGASVGFAFGLPAATALGSLVGWRASFGVMAAVGLLATGLAARLLPRVPGEPPGDRLPFAQVLRLPGVATIAAVTIVLITGHYALYTYVEPFVQRSSLPDGVSVALLLFGCGSLVSVWVAGRVIDRHLYRALLILAGGIVSVLVVLGLAGGTGWLALVVIGLWGLSYGGLTPVMQTAAVRAGGAAADVAVSVTVTGWSLGIGLGAVVGGAAFDLGGARVLPWTALAFVAVAVCGAVAARGAFREG